MSVHFLNSCKFKTVLFTFFVQNRRDRTELTSKGGATEDETVGWHHRLESKEMSLSRLWGMVKDGEAWRAAVRGVAKSQTSLSE